MADEEDVADLIGKTVSAFGRLDAAFNNAGIMTPAVRAADAEKKDFDRVMGVILRGAWNCMRYELRQMEKQKSGSIVNCSSIG